MAATRDLYLQTISQIYLTLIVGEKAMFQSPGWYLPAAGGVWGMDAGIRPHMTNGEPTQQSLMKLARPIIVPVRQNLSVDVEFFPVGTTDALDLLNEDSEDVRIVQVYLDGLQTRDVQ